MALCFRFTSSTFSEILSMKPRISSTCARPASQGETQGGGSQTWGRPKLGLEVRFGERQEQASGGGGSPNILLEWDGESGPVHS